MLFLGLIAIDCGSLAMSAADGWTPWRRSSVGEGESDHVPGMEEKGLEDLRLHHYSSVIQSELLNFNRTIYYLSHVNAPSNILICGT